MADWWQLGLVLATGLVAGFVDSIAGGGGLITLPVLLSLGIDPKLALGTNKLQATFGSGSATVHYARAGAVNLVEWRRDCVFAFVGAVCGSLLVQQLDPNLLKRIIPVLLVVVAIYIWRRPQLGEKDLHPRMTRQSFDVLFGLGIGFYDGFMGPGTGTFFTMALNCPVQYQVNRQHYRAVANAGMKPPAPDLSVERSSSDISAGNSASLT